MAQRGSRQSDPVISITYEMGGVPIELIDEKDWRKAIRQGRLCHDTPITVYRAESPARLLAAEDVPEIRALLDGLDGDAPFEGAGWLPDPPPLTSDPIPATAAAPATSPEDLHWYAGDSGVAAPWRAEEPDWRFPVRPVLTAAALVVLILLVMRCSWSGGPSGNLTVAPPPPVAEPEARAPVSTRQRSTSRTQPRAEQNDLAPAPSEPPPAEATDATQSATPRQPRDPPRNTRRQQRESTMAAPPRSTVTCLLPGGEVQLDYQDCRNRGGSIYR